MVLPSSKHETADKIRNPATGRMVLKSGTIGKRILAERKKTSTKAKSPAKIVEAVVKKVVPQPKRAASPVKATSPAKIVEAVVERLSPAKIALLKRYKYIPISELPIDREVVREKLSADLVNALNDARDLKYYDAVTSILDLMTDLGLSVNLKFYILHAAYSGDKKMIDVYAKYSSGLTHHIPKNIKTLVMASANISPGMKTYIASKF